MSVSKKRNTVFAKSAAAYALPGLPGLPNYFREGGVGMDFQFTRALDASCASGSALGECWVTAHKITDGDIESWYNEWYAMGRKIENIAEISLAGGHDVSAREAFFRAYTYLRTSQFYLEASDPRRQEVFERSRKCFSAAGKLLQPAMEYFTVEADGVELPGYFLAPAGNTKPRPTMIILGGFDSSLEELYFGFGSSALVRGWNALLVEGPGQVTSFMLNGTRFRHDYERPIGAFVDYALSRADVDPNYLAMSSFSMGGHLGLRVACFEHRIKAYVVNSPVPNLRKMLMVAFGMPPIDDFLENADEIVDWDSETVRWFFRECKHRLGGNSMKDIIEGFRAYSIEGLEDQILSPILGILGLGEGVMDPAPEIAAGHIPTQARAFHQRLKVPNELYTFTFEDGAEAHCQLNNRLRLAQVVYDWLDDQFEISGNKLYQV